MTITRCPICDRQKQRCPKCSGSGLALNIETREVETCDKCRGTGEVWVRSVLTIEYVRAKGVTVEFEECPACAAEAGGVGSEDASR